MERIGYMEFLEEVVKKWLRYEGSPRNVLEKCWRYTSSKLWRKEAIKKLSMNYGSDSIITRLERNGEILYVYVNTAKDCEKKAERVKVLYRGRNPADFISYVWESGIIHPEFAVRLEQADTILYNMLLLLCSDLPDFTWVDETRSEYYRIKENKSLTRYIARIRFTLEDSLHSIYQLYIDLLKEEKGEEVVNRLKYAIPDEIEKYAFKGELCVLYKIERRDGEEKRRIEKCVLNLDGEVIFRLSYYVHWDLTERYRVQMSVVTL